MNQLFVWLQHQVKFLKEHRGEPTMMSAPFNNSIARDPPSSSHPYPLAILPALNEWLVRFLAHHVMTTFMSLENAFCIFYQPFSSDGTLVYWPFFLVRCSVRAGPHPGTSRWVSVSGAVLLLSSALQRERAWIARSDFVQNLCSFCSTIQANQRISF